MGASDSPYNRIELVMARKRRPPVVRPAIRIPPAKSIEELAKEQGIPRGPIDFEALFSKPARGRKPVGAKQSQDLTPPKSIRELAKEQGIPDERPDYVALASAVWRTKAEVREFQRFIRSIRQPSRNLDWSEDE